jgi:rhodanese-related sulfurtransferase
VGVRPEVTLAKEAGIEIGPTGAISVDTYMRTNVSAIYAAGDCTESYNILTGQPVYSPQGSVANRQGRTAGHNAAGGNSQFKGVLGGSVAKIFKLTAARTGLNEKEAQKHGFDYTGVHLHPLNRAHIYPEAEHLAIKVLVDNKTEKILGAQVVGQDGADKRVDVFSTAIQAGLKCGELFDVDFAYSPPYAPAKDPAAISGLVAENALNSGVRFVTPQWLYENYNRVGTEVILVDVREPEELVAHGYLQGALNFPLSQFRMRFNELDKESNLVIYCRQGLRGYLAAKILVNKGYSNVANLSGGFLIWPYEEKITHPGTDSP